MRSFAVTWDYRCPFARNAHEHLLTAVAAGAPWDVRFVPFSLNQVHVEPGGVDVWEDPGRAPDLAAMEAGLVVRDRFPAAFPAVHAALFAARHDEGLDVREPEVVRAALEEAGADVDAVMAEVASGAPLETFRKEHERAVADHAVFGVPTVIAGNRATFVRIMDRPHGDAERAVATVERVLDLVEGWPALNELKHTTIPH